MNKQDNYIEHFGIPGMRWGVRRQRAKRDSHGNLTKYGANDLVKLLNKNIKKSTYVRVKYKDKEKKNNYMAYELDKEDEKYLKGKAKVNTLLAGPLGGSIITKYQLDRRLSKKFNNPSGIGPRLN